MPTPSTTRLAKCTSTVLTGTSSVTATCSLAMGITSLIVGAWIDPSTAGTEIVHQLPSRMTCTSYVLIPQPSCRIGTGWNADIADQWRRCPRAAGPYLG